MNRILFYQDARGACSVRDFILDLNRRAQTDKKVRTLLEKVYDYVERLTHKGTWNGYPVTKFLEDGIWELRPGNVRILFFVFHGEIVLLHAFYKTTNKTPRSEIERAKRERIDWFSRHKSGYEDQ